MNEIKALEKLRDELKVCGCDPDNCICCEVPRKVEKLADEIKAEIAERFAALPVDREGEPWRIGDKFPFADAGGKKHVCTVSGVGIGEVFFYYDEHSGSSKHRHLRADKLAHEKPPRTLEDVLRDVWKEALNYAKSDMWRNPDEVFAERADEIRAMFREVGS